MNVHAQPSPTEQERALLLYCPYDRRVTRHARRGPGESIACLECGRRLDFADRPHAGHAPGRLDEPPMLTLARPATHRRARAARFGSESRTSAAPWLLTLVGAAIALLALVNVTGNLLRGGANGPSPPLLAGAPAHPGNEEAGPSLIVANTEGIGAYLRRTPNLDDRLRAWPEGTLLRGLGGDLAVDGLDWKRVRDPAGNEGWIPALYTAPAERS